MHTKVYCVQYYLMSNRNLTATKILRLIVNVIIYVVRGEEGIYTGDQGSSRRAVNVNKNCT